MTGFIRDIPPVMVGFKNDRFRTCFGSERGPRPQSAWIRGSSVGQLDSRIISYRWAYVSLRSCYRTLWHAVYADSYVSSSDHWYVRGGKDNGAARVVPAGLPNDRHRL